MSDDDDDADEYRPSEEEVRAALRSLRGAGEPALDDIMTLVNAGLGYSVSLVPSTVTEAVAVRFEIAGDLANGGMDQVAWNHGHQLARAYAESLRVVGAIENADLLERLAASLEAFLATHADGVAADPIGNFLAYRRLVGGPYFQVPDFDEELAECLIEHVLDRVSELPDPEGELPLKSR